MRNSAGSMRSLRVCGRVGRYARALIIVGLTACALPRPTGRSDDGAVFVTTSAPATPPTAAARFRFTTNERFDASSVPAYRGSHPEIYAHIERNRAEHLENLRRWL